MAIMKKEPKSVNMVGVDDIPFKAILGEDIGKAVMEVSSRLPYVDSTREWLTPGRI